jgi:hypothetical protein
MRNRSLRYVTAASAIVVAAFALAISANPAHAASDTFHFSVKGQLAEAYFSSSDPSGCVITSVAVFTDDNRYNSGPGGPETLPLLTVQLSKFDQCTGTLLLEANGQTVPEELQTDKQLTAATLDTTIKLFDYVSETPVSVSANIAWTGTGATVTQRSHTQYAAPGFKMDSRLSGTFRDATAIGTVSDGTTNFTPEPATSARLGSVQIGEVTIVRE